MPKITHPINSRFEIGKYVVDSEMSYEICASEKRHHSEPMALKEVLMYDFFMCTRNFASMKPVEFATVLNSLHGLPFFYLNAHGDNSESRWTYAPIESSYGYPRISLEERLANEQAGGALLKVCNPGGYVLRNISFPVMHSLGAFSISDIENDPNRMTLYTPEGITTVQPEKALDIITNYLDLQRELDITAMREHRLPAYVLEERRREYDKSKRIVRAILTTNPQLPYLGIKWAITSLQAVESMGIDWVKGKGAIVGYDSGLKIGLEHKLFDKADIEAAQANYQKKRVVDPS